jgi:hypothetical protein
MFIILGLVPVILLTTPGCPVGHDDHDTQSCRDDREVPITVTGQIAAENSAVKKLEGYGRGFFVWRDPKMRGHPVVRVGFCGDEWTDDALPELKAFGRLRELLIHHTVITAKGMKEIAHFTSLKTFHIECRTITQEQLEAISEASHLEELGFLGCEMQVQDWNPLKGMRLGTLVLSKCRLKDQDLKGLREAATIRALSITSTRISRLAGNEIGSLGNLHDLVLGGVGLSDAGLGPLGNLKELRTLQVWSNDVTDKGLSSIRKCAKLRELDLRWTKVTDAGIPRITELKDLITLDVSGTGVTEQGAAKLRKEMPRALVTTGDDSVDHDPPG